MKKRQKMFGKNLLAYSMLFLAMNATFVSYTALKKSSGRVELYKSYNKWVRDILKLSPTDRIDVADYKKVCFVLDYYNQLMDSFFGVCVSLKHIADIQRDGAGIIDRYIIKDYLVLDLGQEDFLYTKNSFLLNENLFNAVSLLINMRPLHEYNSQKVYTPEQIFEQKGCLNLLLQTLQNQDQVLSLIAKNMLHFYLMHVFTKSMNGFLVLKREGLSFLENIKDADHINKIILLVKEITKYWMQSNDPESPDAQEYFNLMEFPQVMPLVNQIIDHYGILSRSFSFYTDIYGYCLEKIPDKERGDLPESLYFKTQIFPLTVEVLYTNKERLKQVFVKQPLEQEVISPAKDIDQITRELEKEFPESKPKPKPKAKGKKKKTILAKEERKEQEVRGVLQSQSEDDVEFDTEQRKNKERQQVVEQDRPLIKKGKAPRIQEGWHTIERVLPRVQYAARVYSRYYSTVQEEQADKKVYHDTPLLLDKYLIKYGFKKRYQNATYPGVIDEQYNGYGAIQYPDGKIERVIFVATKGGVDGRIYHRGVLRLRDQKNVSSTEDVPFPRAADDGDAVDINQSSSNISELNDLYCVYFENKQTGIKYILFKSALKN